MGFTSTSPSIASIGLLYINTGVVSGSTSISTFTFFGLPRFLSTTSTSTFAVKLGETSYGFYKSLSTKSPSPKIEAGVSLDSMMSLLPALVLKDLYF